VPTGEEKSFQNKEIREFPEIKVCHVDISTLY